MKRGTCSASVRAACWIEDLEKMAKSNAFGFFARKRLYSLSVRRSSSKRLFERHAVEAEIRAALPPLFRSAIEVPALQVIERRRTKWLCRFAEVLPMAHDKNIARVIRPSCGRDGAIRKEILAQRELVAVLADIKTIRQCLGESLGGFARDTPARFRWRAGLRTSLATSRRTQPKRHVGILGIGQDKTTRPMRSSVNLG